MGDKYTGKDATLIYLYLVGYSGVIMFSVKRCSPFFHTFFVLILYDLLPVKRPSTLSFSPGICVFLQIVCFS